jgi:hypothetical protein
MKTKKDFTYSRAIAYGVATELFLVVVQYILLAMYHRNNPGSSFTFSTEYMMSRGFYIFLIPGLIVYATVVFMIMRNYTLSSVAYLFAFLLAAAAVEVTFYLSISADYQGAFLYSILDKVIGSALGAIGYFALNGSEEVKEQRK